MKDQKEQLGANFPAHFFSLQKHWEKQTLQTHLYWYRI